MRGAAEGPFEQELRSEVKPSFTPVRDAALPEEVVDGRDNNPRVAQTPPRLGRVATGSSPTAINKRGLPHKLLCLRHPDAGASGPPGMCNKDPARRISLSRAGPNGVS